MTPEDRAQLLADLADLLKPAVVPQLSEDEHTWVKLAIQKEAQAIALRKAIIEKTLAGLIWAALVGVGYVFMDFLKNHGFK